MPSWDKIKSYIENPDIAAKAAMGELRGLNADADAKKESFVNNDAMNTLALAGNKVPSPEQIAETTNRTKNMYDTASSVADMPGTVDKGVIAKRLADMAERVNPSAIVAKSPEVAANIAKSPEAASAFNKLRALLESGNATAAEASLMGKVTGKVPIVDTLAAYKNKFKP